MPLHGRVNLDIERLLRAVPSGDGHPRRTGELGKWHHHVQVVHFPKGDVAVELRGDVSAFEQQDWNLVGLKLFDQTE